MHWTFLAPELSATSSIERGWIIGQDTWLRTLRIRQRFCLEIGRVSSTRTRSPTRLSLFSSCALSCFDIRMTRWYRGWRNTRSIRTTRVFCIASDTTTPSRLFRSPTGCAFPLAEHGVRPRQILLRLAQPRRVLGHPHRELEPEIEDLLGQLPRLLLELVLGELTPLRRFHGSILDRARLVARRASARSFIALASSLDAPRLALQRPRARHELRRDADLLGRGPERVARHVLGHADHLVQDPARLHDGHPLLRVALALAHPGLGRLLGDRLVRKDANPHLTTTLEAPGERHARGLDLSVGDPSGLEGLQAEVAEGQGRATDRDPLHPAALRLAVLDPLGHQHGASPQASAGAARSTSPLKTHTLTPIVPYVVCAVARP